MLTQASALGLTLLVEAPIVMLASVGAPRRLAWRIAAAFLPSCLTHPLAWHAAGNFSAQDYMTGLCLIELIVVMVEMLLLRLLTGMRWRAVLLISIAANTASTLTGLALT